MYVAVHIVTESCDHYNWLLDVEYTTDVVEALDMGDELAYICDLYVDSNISAEVDDEIKRLIREASAAIEGEDF